jgi:ABC-type multidrug transport system fused ATPase/permease subunit
MTVLMVAHRLDTAVRYCEKIMVLDAGRVAEYSNALDLLCVEPTEHLAITRTNGIFASMVLALSDVQ